jgi:hypothetical protein
VSGGLIERRPGLALKIRKGEMAVSIDHAEG